MLLQRPGRRHDVDAGFGGSGCSRATRRRSSLVHRDAQPEREWAGTLTEQCALYLAPSSISGASDAQARSGMRFAFVQDGDAARQHRRHDGRGVILDAAIRGEDRRDHRSSVACPSCTGILYNRLPPASGHRTRERRLAQTRFSISRADSRRLFGGQPEPGGFEALDTVAKSSHSTSGCPAGASTSLRLQLSRG